MVDRRLKPHDSNQLELKLAYVLEPGEKRQRYRVETFMFVPRTLGVTPQSYPADRFYEDTSAFVRLKTPRVALSSLGRQDQATHWFQVVAVRLDKLLAGEERRTHLAIHRLKVLGCVYRSALRDESRELLDRFEALPGRKQPGGNDREDEIARAVGGFLDDVEQAIERLRELGERCDHAAMPRDVREMWRVVDEYVALFAEEICTRFVEAIDERGAEGPLGKLRDRLAATAIGFFKYRSGRGYPSYVHPEEENEHLPYRRRLLKRIVSSALFLDIRHEEPGRLVNDVIGMIAAALAMLFAVLVALWAQATWDMFSGAFVAAMVVSYAVKDRIKEWGKRYLGRGARRFSPDQVIQIRNTEGGEVIGHCKEAFHIVRSSDVDPQIRELRHIDHPGGAASAGRPEAVIHYTKEIVLSSEGLHRQIDEVDGLNDIIRFNLSRLRERMDEPFEDYLLVDPDTHKVVTVPCARVYHVNLVLRFTSGRGRSQRTETERVRVVLDQRGIKRVDPIRIGPSGGTEDRVIGASFVDTPEPA